MRDGLSLNYQKKVRTVLLALYNEDYVSENMAAMWEKNLFQLGDGELRDLPNMKCEIGKKDDWRLEVVFYSKEDTYQKAYAAEWNWKNEIGRVLYVDNPSVYFVKLPKEQFLRVSGERKTVVGFSFKLVKK